MLCTRFWMIPKLELKLQLIKQKRCEIISGTQIEIKEKKLLRRQANASKEAAGKAYFVKVAEGKNYKMQSKVQKQFSTVMESQRKRVLRLFFIFFEVARHQLFNDHFNTVPGQEDRFDSVESDLGCQGPFQVINSFRVR